MRLYRSIEEPIRKNLSWAELWKGPDNGLVCCWERGREKRIEDPDLAVRASNGELVPRVRIKKSKQYRGLVWKGGVEKKLEAERKPGTLKYLAAWQGLRGEDLDIDPDGERVIECAKTGQLVVFSAAIVDDDEDDNEDDDEDE
jgi:hypothetical protein